MGMVEVGNSAWLDDRGFTFPEPLNTDLQKGMERFGVKELTEIQIDIIQKMMEGKDIVLQAQSGIGKSTAYMVGACRKVNTNLPIPQVLIIVPTRELAEQINFVIVS